MNASPSGSLMAWILGASNGCATPTPEALAEVQRHVIDHETGRCACGRKPRDPLEHLGDVVRRAIGAPAAPQPASTPAARSRRVGWSEGGPNRIDTLIDYGRTDQEIATELGIPKRLVTRRRDTRPNFPEEEAA